MKRKNRKPHVVRGVDKAVVTKWFFIIVFLVLGTFLGNLVIPNNLPEYITLPIVWATVLYIFYSLENF